MTRSSPALKDRIARHIRMAGPLPLAEYMHWCLADKTDGYYQSSNAIGRAGDFITAPEVSQMFGELIGIWLIKAWQALGSPGQVNLVELGPGNGTLMADILRVTRVDPAFTSAVKTHLVETSPGLTKVQQQKLNGLGDIEWHASMDTVPKGTTLFVANEFLDALPFRQYVKLGKSWLERCVSIDENNNLEWVLGNGKIEPEALPTGHQDEPDGAVFEISTIREGFAERVCQTIAGQGGAALFIDYGHGQSGFGDTFQALSAHEYADPLAEPGTVDLTSHVDFHPLFNVAEKAGCSTHCLLRQGEFLLRLGLLERAGRLGADKPGDVQARLTREAERLALPDQMGDLFKVFAVSSVPQLWPFD
ncbi:MAG: SAM-dependent methyltransferase [Pseudomonadota bacterium]